MAWAYLGGLSHLLADGIERAFSPSCENEELRVGWQHLELSALLYSVVGSWLDHL